LFASALELLDRTYSPQKELITAIADVVMLPNEKVSYKPSLGIFYFMSSLFLIKNFSPFIFLTAGPDIWGFVSDEG